MFGPSLTLTLCVKGMQCIIDYFFQFSILMVLLTIKIRPSTIKMRGTPILFKTEIMVETIFTGSYSSFEDE